MTGFETLQTGLSHGLENLVSAVNDARPGSS